MANNKAISPREVVKYRKESIPNVVLEAFNALIKEKFNVYSAVVFQDDIVEILEEKGFARNDIYDRHWLDVEDIYREKGWNVKYDKPGYCEDYRAYFEFKAKK